MIRAGSQLSSVISLRNSASTEQLYLAALRPAFTKPMSSAMVVKSGTERASPKLWQGINEVIGPAVEVIKSSIGTDTVIGPAAATHGRGILLLFGGRILCSAGHGRNPAS